MPELAQKQENLAQGAAHVPRKTNQAAQVAQTQPLKSDQAKEAAKALRQGNINEALTRQDQARQDMERLAKDLDQARERARDPREEARQLSRLQEGLRQQLKSERQKNDPQSPLQDRLAKLQKEQEALQRSAKDLPLSPKYDNALKDRAEAAKRAGEAAEALKRQDPDKA